MANAQVGKIEDCSVSPMPNSPNLSPQKDGSPTRLYGKIRAWALYFTAPLPAGARPRPRPCAAPSWRPTPACAPRPRPVGRPVKNPARDPATRRVISALRAPCRCPVAARGFTCRLREAGTGRRLRGDVDRHALAAAPNLRSDLRAEIARIRTVGSPAGLQAPHGNPRE